MAKGDDIEERLIDFDAFITPSSEPPVEIFPKIMKSPIPR